MYLFISYARVDQRYCTQIVETLEAHKTWYDQRLYMGEDWWEEIVKRIKECDAFLYLISPESVDSEYCRRELSIALEEKKHIFPVLIQARTTIPPEIRHIQYIDMSRGLTVDTVKSLLGAITIAERYKRNDPKQSDAFASSGVGSGKSGGGHGVSAHHQGTRPGLPEKLIHEAAQAMERKEYDKAVYLLKQIKHLKPRFIDIDKLLKEAEDKLEKQTYRRDAEREYQAIVSLIRHSSTHDFGCHAFRSFREQFPDHDPENIATYCGSAILPTLKWCNIDEGEVTVRVGKRKIVFFVNSFQISKYPITNAQFQLFVAASDGYHDDRWWRFSESAQVWHRENPEMMKPHAQWGDHPRTNVNWYEAKAFCQWMSFKTGQRISLPKEEYWQRAGQGDDERRYPWGNEFNANLCNIHESEINKTSPVMRFVNSTSPYGVVDMVGNVWEWCDTNRYSGSPSEDCPDGKRVVRGGSYAKTAKQATLLIRRQLEPDQRKLTVGFRVMIRS